MHDVITSLEKQRHSHGCIALDKVQSDHLILWLKALMLAIEQQDALIAKLKIMAGIDNVGPPLGGPAKPDAVDAVGATGEATVQTSALKPDEHPQPDRN